MSTKLYGKSPVILWVFLSLLALTRVGVAYAQGGGGSGSGYPGGGYGGQGPWWHLTYVYLGQGIDAFADINDVFPQWNAGGNDSWGGDPQPGGKIDHYLNPFDQLQILSTGVVTVNANWLNADGTPGANPPPKLYLLINPNVYWYTRLQDVAGLVNHSADNGLGGQETVTYDAYHGIMGTNNQSRLVQLDGSSGFATKDVHMSANLWVQAGSADWTVSGTGAELHAAVDTRSAMISSALDQQANYKKGPGPAYLPVPNLRNQDGSMQVDTTYGSTQDHFTETDVYLLTYWLFDQTLSAVTTGFDITTLDPNRFQQLLNTRITWDGNVSPGHGGVDVIAPLDLTADANAIGVACPGPPELPATLTAKIHVEDVRPYMDAVADNNYTIIIHAPFENGKEDPVARIFDHNDKYPWSDTVSGGSNVQVSMIDQEARSWSLAGDFIGGVCGSGASVAILATSPVAGLPELACFVLESIAWTVKASGDPDPETSSNVMADEAAFELALSDQNTINWDNAHAPGQLNDDVDCPEDARFTCTDDVLAKINSNPSYYFSNSRPMAKGHNGERYDKLTVTGDAYGAAGYTGRVSHYPVLPMGHFKHTVWQWTVDNITVP